MVTMENIGRRKEKGRENSVDRDLLKFRKCKIGVVLATLFIS